MTDNDIIKALEMCGKRYTGCSGCPYFGIGGHEDRNRDILDLINRQKAEIENYRKIVREVEFVRKSKDEYYARIEADANAKNAELQRRIDELQLENDELKAKNERCKKTAEYRRVLNDILYDAFDEIKGKAIKEYMNKVIDEIVNKPAKFKASEGTADFLSGMAHRQIQIIDIIEEMVGDNDESTKNS